MYKERKAIIASYRKQAEETLVRLNKNYLVKDLQLESDYACAQGTRFFLRTSTRYISPRLKGKDLITWLEGFEAALELLYYEGRK
jgi:hypothetical protein